MRRTNEQAQIRLILSHTGLTGAASMLHLQLMSSIYDITVVLIANVNVFNSLRTAENICCNYGI